MQSRIGHKTVYILIFLLWLVYWGMRYQTLSYSTGIPIPNWGIALAVSLLFVFQIIFNTNRGWLALCLFMGLYTLYELYTILYFILVFLNREFSQGVPKGFLLDWGIKILLFLILNLILWKLRPVKSSKSKFY